MSKVEEQILIYPTDTVWGIGAALSHIEAHQLVLKIKKNKMTKPVSLLFQNIDQLRDYIKIPEYLNNKLEELFKFNLTLLFPLTWLRRDISKSIYQESLFIGTRIASLTLEKEIRKMTSEPITTTSLNFDGEVAITNEKEALTFKNQNAPHSAFISQKGVSMSGLPSSILSVTSDSNKQLSFSIIRRGIDFSDLEKKLGL